MSEGRVESKNMSDAHEIAFEAGFSSGAVRRETGRGRRETFNVTCQSRSASNKTRMRWDIARFGVQRAQYVVRRMQDAGPSVAVRGCMLSTLGL